MRVARAVVEGACAILSTHDQCRELERERNALLQHRGFGADLCPGGSGVLAWTFPAKPASANAYDVAPTLCDLLGFPATREMPGRSIASVPELPRIATFGRRAARAETAKVNDEYYKSLKSLGYIR